MLICSSFSLSLRSDASAKDKGPKTMLNSDFLFKGYNIFYGNPHPNTGSIDPGFRAPIFDVTYKAGLKSADNRYAIPDGCFFNNVAACDLTTRDTEITSESSYKRELSTEVGVAASIEGIEFSASIGFKDVFSSTSEKKIAFYETKAECKVYTGALHTFDPPALDPRFIKGLKSLNKAFKDDNNSYWKFIGFFGTHIVTEVKMGARFGATSKLTFDKLAKMRSNSLNIKSALSIPKLVNITRSGGLSVDTSDTNSETFTDIHVYSIGSTPPEDMKATTWAAAAIKEPMPISYDLTSITDVLHSDTISFDLTPLAGLDLTFLRTNLDLALKAYCKSYLLVKNEVRSCVDLQKDVKIGPAVNTNIEDGKKVMFKNADTGLCLKFKADNNPIITETCDAKDSSKSMGLVYRPSSAKYSICTNGGERNYYACWDLIHGSSDENYQISPVRDANHPNQDFELIKNDDNSYTFKTAAGKCVQVKSSNRAEGSPVVQNTCNRSPAQRWIAIVL